MRYPLIASVICIFLIQGCATQQISLSSRQKIHRIAVIGPENPDHIGLAEANVYAAIAMSGAVGPGAGAGAMGASLIESGRENALTNALHGEHLQLGDTLNRAVKTALTQDGYEIARDAAGADAVLKIEFNECRYERPPLDQIMPNVQVTWRLIDPKNGDTQFKHHYWYFHSMLGSAGYMTQYTPDDKYHFDTAADVLAHPHLAADGLRDAIPLVSETIKQELKRSAD